MTKIVYLHIGDGRCGSSAIQQFAAGVSDQLSERGISYPSAVEMGFPAYLGGNADVLRHQNESTAEVAAQMARHVAAADAERVLLSSEFLFSMAPRLGEIIAPFQAHSLRVVIVAYVREQREALISRYAHVVKRRGQTAPLGEFLRAHAHVPRLDYLAMLGPVAELVDGGDFVIRLFQPSEMPAGDVRMDIFGALGVDVSDLASRPERANASAGVEEVEVMRILNTLGERRPVDPAIFLDLAQGLREARGWPAERALYKLADPEILREIAEGYRESNDALRRRFFPDRSGPLFTSSIPDDFEPLPADERVNERSLVMLATYFLQAASARRAAKLARAEARPSDAATIG